MADDYSRSAASPKSITLAGREYLVGKFTPRDIGDLQSWLKEQVPNPRKEAREYMEGLPDVVALEIWRDAVERAKDWPPTLQSVQGHGLLTMSFEGNARLIWVTLRRHNPGFGIESAREIAGLVDISEINRLVSLAAVEGDGSPKKGEPTTETGTA